jgi:hypothetical protein
MTRAPCVSTVTTPHMFVMATIAAKKDIMNKTLSSYL